MKRKESFSKVLALVGTVLVWFPIAFAVIASGIVLIRSGMFHFDYLIPAEIAPVPLAGSLLLLWAALRAKYKLGAVGWGIAAFVFFLVGSQVVAVLTGLASGEIAEGGWQMFMVMGGLIAYDLAVIWLGIAGIQLILELYRRDRQAVAPAKPLSPSID